MRIRNVSARSLSSRVRRFQTAARDLCARRFSRRHLTLCRWVFCLCSSWLFLAFKKKSWRNCAVCFGTRCTCAWSGFYRDLCSFIIWYTVYSICNFIPSIKRWIESEIKWKEVVQAVEKVQLAACSMSTNTVEMHPIYLFFFCWKQNSLAVCWNGRKVNELKSVEWKL